MTTEELTTDLYVGGKWTPSSGTATIEVVSPASGQWVAVFSQPTKEDADRAVQAARYAGAAPATCAVLVAAEPYRAMALVMSKLYPSAGKPGSAAFPPHLCGFSTSSRSAP